MPSGVFRAKRLVAAGIAAGRQLFRVPVNEGNRIITFHAIDTPVDGDTNGIYNMSRQTFTKHVRALKQLSDSPQGFRVQPVGVLRDRTLAITFDDGYASTLTIAAALLAESNMPFCVYVTPMLIDSADRRYLDRQQLFELSRIPNVTIGAHGYRHVPLSSLSMDERRRQLADAKSWIEDIVQSEVRSMSYPFGDAPPGIQDVALETGYQLAACSVWGVNHHQTDRMMLRRIDLWEGDSERSVVSKVEGQWDWIMGARTK